MGVDEVCSVARESLVDRRLMALAIRIVHERCLTRRFGSEGHNDQWISTFLTTLPPSWSGKGRQEPDSIRQPGTGRRSNEYMAVGELHGGAGWRDEGSRGVLRALAGFLAEVRTDRRRRTRKS